MLKIGKFEVKALEDFPEYVAARKKYADITAERSEAETAYNELVSAHAEHGPSSHEAKAAEYLATGVIPQDIPDSVFARQLGERSEKKAVLERAQMMTRKDLEKTTYKVSQEIVKDIGGPYTELLANIIQAMVALSKLETERFNFVQACEREGIKLVGLPSIPTTDLGNLDDEFSRIHRIIAEAQRDGICTRRQLDAAA